MDSDLIAAALRDLPSIRFRISDGRLDLHVPGVNDSILVPVENIHWMHRTLSPTRAPAVALELRNYGVEQPLIVTDEDIVFPPADPPPLRDTAIRFHVSGAPPLVAYTEMERGAAQMAFECADLRGRNLAAQFGSCLLIRCFIEGAVRFGAWPIKAAAFWHRGWRLAGEQMTLPALRHDPTWDALAVDAAAVVL